MKIAVLTNRFPCRSETFVLNQVTGLIDRGHDVAIYANNGWDETAAGPEFERYDLASRILYFQGGRRGLPKNKLTRLTRSLGILRENWRDRHFSSIKSLNVAKYGTMAASLALLYKSKTFAGNGAYDIVHCHFGPVGKMAAALKDAGAIRGKVITTFHGYDVWKYVRQNGPRAYKSLFAQGDLFLAVSDRIKRELVRLGCNREKIVVHRMGIDLGRFKFSERIPAKHGKVRLLSVARFAEKKGLEYGIRAVGQVVKKHPNLEYRIVGDGELRNRIVELIARLGLRQHVNLLGWKSSDEVASLMQDSDIFLAPSVTSRCGDQEGVPVVLMEALASGLPVLSTRHSGIPELVRDGESGLLVPERDPNALAQQLEYLCTHPESWAEYGRRGRDWVESEFEIDRLNDRLVTLFDRVQYVDGSMNCGSPVKLG